jgi:hypothetical protein
MFFGIHNKEAKHELAQQLTEQNSPHVHQECMAVKKLPFVGMPSTDFSDDKQLTEFTRKKPKYNTD